MSNSNVIEFFEVGGCVRDQFLGLPTKDIDYTVVGAESFSHMRDHLTQAGFEIFVESPEYLTIRARFPRGALFFGKRDIEGLTADFVMARAEGEYKDGRHPDEVRPGTLFDDLARRDFTVNAMALDGMGQLIDPHGGRMDIHHRLLRAVGNAEDRIREDALRALRAVRFAITKDFTIHDAVMDVLHSHWLPGLLGAISVERRREELLRAFKHSTVDTLLLLNTLPHAFREATFADGLWLKPTLEH